MRYVINDLKLNTQTNTQTHEYTSAIYFVILLNMYNNIEVDLTDIDKTCKPCTTKKYGHEILEWQTHNSDGGSADTTPPKTTTK